ncbi:MAG TPA: CopD family protein [Cyclobacteriaceae bacterium]
MTFLYLKAVHIVFVVTWFAGLFYLPRLLVYITEAHAKPEPEKTVLSRQLYSMARRLWYGITWPSAVITLGMGVALLVDQPAYLKMDFMHLKLALVVLLYGYHFSLQHLMNRFGKGIVRYSSQQLRAWNEVPTLFLIAIVFIIVVRDKISVAWGLAGLVIVTLAILAGIRLYKKFRND